MDFIGEITGLLTEFYEPNKKTRYVELYSRVFPLGKKLDPDCRYCGSEAFYALTNYLKLSNRTEMAKTESSPAVVSYELVFPNQIATVKLFDRFMKLDVTTDQAVLEAAYKAGHTNYVKKVGE